MSLISAIFAEVAVTRVLGFEQTWLESWSFKCQSLGSDLTESPCGALLTEGSAP